MKSNVSQSPWSARYPGPTLFLCLSALLFLTAAPGAARAAPASNHREAVAAFADLNAAIAELTQASASQSTNRNDYYRASQRAINALEGAGSPYYVAKDGNPGDATGAIGHLDHALQHVRAGSVWEAPLDSAEASMRGAVAHLLDARHAHSLTQFGLSASRAITYLEVARGRPTQLGALGGLEGALASTVLGVPDGAKTEDACAAPTAAPAYGIHGGYLAWVATSTKVGVHPLAMSPGGTSIIVHDDTIELPTAAAAEVAKICTSHASNNMETGAARAAVAPSSASPSRASHPAGQAPALYTKAQAKAGESVFAANCAVCHGTNLQGVSAPAVAGKAFLDTAHSSHWTVRIMRSLIFNNMPFSNPGSLAPKQYTDVLAYLLASNCYPAGTTMLPETAGSNEAKLKLAPIPGNHPNENKYGVCQID